jgi:hypothetical protein
MHYLLKLGFNIMKKYIILISLTILTACSDMEFEQDYTLNLTRTPIFTQTLKQNITPSQTKTAKHNYEICSGSKILFIGGSITAGAGSSEKSKSYSEEVGSWFDFFCGKEFKIKNISISGTGSDFAVYRLEHDLHDFIPDIAFYEFAVNDGGNENNIRKHVEGLIFKLNRLNPEMKIFSILTTMENHKRFYSEGDLPPIVEIHSQIASDSNIPAINVGQSLWKYLSIENEGI